MADLDSTNRLGTNDTLVAPEGHAVALARQVKVASEHGDAETALAALAQSIAALAQTVAALPSGGGMTGGISRDAVINIINAAFDNGIQEWARQPPFIQGTNDQAYPPADALAVDAVKEYFLRPNSEGFLVWEEIEIPEQRVLVGQALDKDKFSFIHEKPYIARLTVVHEATPRSATWQVYADSKYLGVRRSGDPTDAASRVRGNWYFDGPLHIPIRYETAADGRESDDWYDTDIPTVINGGVYIGDYINNNEATPHVNANGNIYYNHRTDELLISSDYTAGTGPISILLPYRLLDNQDLENLEKKITDGDNHPEISGWDTITIVPGGISDQTFPTSFDIVFSNITKAVSPKDVTVIIAGQTATLSSDTPVSGLNAAGARGSGMLRFTYQQSVADTIGNNIPSSAESITVQVNVTYDDDSSETFDIPFLVNNPEHSGAVDATARAAAQANAAAITALRQEPGPVLIVSNIASFDAAQNRFEDSSGDEVVVPDGSIVTLAQAVYDAAVADAQFTPNAAAIFLTR